MRAPPRAERTSGLDAALAWSRRASLASRGPLGFLLATLLAVIAGTAAYAGVQLVYLAELDLLPETVDGTLATIFDLFGAHRASYGAWLAMTVAAVFVARRTVHALEDAHAAEATRTRELALISELSSVLAGPRSIGEICALFLQRAREAIAPDATMSVILAFDGATRFRSLAEDGPRKGEFTGQLYDVSALPDPVRRRVVTDRRELIVYDTEDAGPVWQELVHRFPQLAGSRCFAIIPLASRDRLVGVLTMRSDAPKQFDPARIALLRTLAQYLAGASHTALLLEEEQARAEREAELAREHERVSKAKSEFVSVLSHEFRTPLTGISGFAEMIRDEDLSADEIRDYADEIKRSAQRLGRMIAEVLDLDRLESGRTVLTLASVPFDEVVRDATTPLALTSPGHTLRLDVAPVTLSGDRDKLTQVVTNLVANAIKYSPDGGTVTVASRVEDDQVHLTVADEGVGIPEASLEAVFERYSRVEDARTHGVAGTGLGLPIVREIVQMHGGRVWAESTPGKGSTFHVTLPLAPVTTTGA